MSGFDYKIDFQGSSEEKRRKITLTLSKSGIKDEKSLSKEISQELKRLISMNSSIEKLNQEKAQQYQISLEGYRQKKAEAEQKGQELKDPEPQAPNYEDQYSIEGIDISGFEKLEARQQVLLLKSLVETFYEKNNKYLLDHGFAINLVSSPGSLPSAKKAAQAAARQCLLDKQDVEAIEGRHPFSAVISSWLNKARQRNGRKLYHPNCEYEKDMDHDYRGLMGESLLEELVLYLSTLSRDPASKKSFGISEFVYAHSRLLAPGLFSKELEILIRAAYFPMNLRLRKEDYDSEEFKSLTALIKGARDKGIEEINLENACFSKDQLKELLTLIQTCNQARQGVCRLINLKEKALSTSPFSVFGPTSLARSFLVEAIEKALAENHRILNRQRLLTLLTSGALSAAPAPSGESRDLSPPPEEEKKARSDQPLPSRAPRDFKASLAKRSLKALLARIDGQKAQVHVQLQEQQQQQQEKQEERTQEQHQDVNQGLEALDQKEIVDYPRWLSDEFYIGYRLTPTQEALELEHESMWFEWTLKGLLLAHNLDGFTPNAIKKIRQHASLCRDGFDFDCLPQGFSVRTVQRGGKALRVLCHDPALPSSTSPFAVKLTELATHSKKTDVKSLTALVKLADVEALNPLIAKSYCYKNLENNHGLCPCIGCTQTPEQKPLNTFKGVQKNLERQRKVCYSLLWGNQAIDEIEGRFPILRCLSLRHLRLVLEIAAEFDLDPEHGSKRKPEIVEALLDKLQQIRMLDGDPLTFDLFFRYVLQTSDDWASSLMGNDDQLVALNGLCTLSPEDRANWNWLIKRHGESCGYADLDHLWAAFQAFNQQYKSLVPGARPLDFRKFPPESVKNMYLFLHFLVIILTNARNKREQMELLAEGNIKIDQTGAFYASRYQKYYLVSQEMRLEVDQDEIERAQVSVQKTAPPNIIRYQDLKKGLGRPRPVEYQTGRSASFDRQVKAKDFFRYLGQQPHAALPFSFYRQCIAEYKIQEQDEFHQWVPMQLKLLALTSAHKRAADLKEGPSSQSLWELFKDKWDLYEIGYSVVELVSWHKTESFSPLTFVEAVSFIHYWSQVSLDQQQPLWLKTKTLLNDHRYREPFLRVIREVYAKPLLSESPLALLPLDDYLTGIEKLKSLFESEEKASLERKEPLKPATQDLPDREWREKLCEFLSKLDCKTHSGPFNHQPIIDELGKLLPLQTVQGHSLARRLIVMLGGLAPASLKPSELIDLLKAAQAKVTPDTPLTDEDLFKWLQTQGPLYAKLHYPGLRTTVTHPPCVQSSILGLLEAFHISNDIHKKHITAILEGLWDPKGELSGLEAKALADKNRLIEKEAHSFLKVLLSKKAVWRKLDDKLLKLLADHSKLRLYNFSFFTQFLETIAELPYINTELVEIQALLAASPEQVSRLVALQDPFCKAVEKIGKLPLLKPHQRKSALALVQAYASSECYDQDDLSLSNLSDFLISFTEANPLATDDILKVLTKTLKANPAQFSATVVLLKPLLTKLAEAEAKTRPMAVLPRREAKAEVREEDEEREEKEEKPEVRAAFPRSKLLAKLLHGLGGEVDGRKAADIVKTCAGEGTPVEIIAILAEQIGRKDSGEHVERFLRLLTEVYKNREAFALLHRLSLHPPKLGIQTLLAKLERDGALIEPASLIETLQKLEVDPYDLGFRPEDDPFNLSKIAAKIAQVTEPSRHVSGAAGVLFPSQQQALLEMVCTVEALSNHLAAFPVADGKAVPAKELTQAQIAELIQNYRQQLAPLQLKLSELNAQLKDEKLTETQRKELELQKRAIEENQQKILLPAISLMRVAMRRTPKKWFANDSQIAAVCMSMVYHTDDHCFIQVDTGQGKTLINAFNAACMWLLFGQTMVLTSDSGLAARDLKHLREFFDILGIPCADKIITQTTPSDDYCQGGINYGTSAGLELSRHKARLGKPGVLASQEMGLIIDEVDDPFFDDRTDFRFTIPQIETDSEGESPIAIYYDAMNQFPDTTEYKALLAKEDAQEEEAFEALRKFLLNPPPGICQPNLVQRRAMEQILHNNPDQVKTWFTSIIRAKEMRLGVHFTKVTVSIVIEGELRKIKKVCPYASNGRSNPSVQFSDGLQQLLQAKMRKKTGDNDYLIQQESEVLISSNNDSVFTGGFARIVGATGSVGSAQRIQTRLRSFPIRVNIIPPHQDKQRVDEDAQYCQGKAAHKAAIQARVREWFVDDPDGDFLLIAKHSEQLKEVKAWVEEELARPPLSEMKITRETLDGEQSQKEEDDIVARTGKGKTLLYATRVAGRGLDIILEGKSKNGLGVGIVYPPPNQTQEIQHCGRSGRQGQEGRSFRIINEEELVTKDGRQVKFLEDFYAANEAWDYHEWQLKSYLGYLYDVLLPPFLTVNEQVLGLGDADLRLFWQYAQINRLKNLQQTWETLKEEAHLEALWVKDKAAYEIALKTCQKRLLDEACREWSQTLNLLESRLHEFNRRKQAEHEQALKQAREKCREEKDSPAPPKPRAVVAAAEARAEPLRIEKPWENTSMAKRIKKLIELAKAAQLKPEDLEERLPKEQLPYMDLPLPTDADLPAPTPPFINTARVYFDALLAAEDSKGGLPPTLQALKKQAFEAELRDIAQQLELKDQDPKVLLKACLDRLIPALTTDHPEVKSIESTDRIQEALLQPETPPALSKDKAEREYHRLLALLDWSGDAAYREAASKAQEQLAKANPSEPEEEKEEKEQKEENPLAELRATLIRLQEKVSADASSAPPDLAPKISADQEWLEALVAAIPEEQSAEEKESLDSLILNLEQELSLFLTTYKANAPHYADYHSLQDQVGRAVKALSRAREADPKRLVFDVAKCLITTLVKTKFIDAETPDKEKTAAISKFFRQHYPDLEANNLTLTVGQEKLYRRMGFMLAQRDIDSYASKLVAITIKGTLNEEAFFYEAYFDPVNGTVLFPSRASLIREFEPSRDRPKPPPHIPEEEQVEQKRDIAAQTEQKETAHYAWWLLLALSCMVSGAAFSVTGLAAGLGLPLISLAHWTLMGSFTTATLGLPGFWALAGIGMAYGFAVFLTIFALVKISQAIIQATQASSAPKYPKIPYTESAGKTPEKPPQDHPTNSRDQGMTRNDRKQNFSPRKQ